MAADAYDSFMGRYSTRLAPLFADFAGVEPGRSVIDVGCGPGALTTELVARLGTDHVAAADPSPSFVEACRLRHPGVVVHRAPAESLPLDDATYDAALAQLVVHFMSDPVAGLREMARVTRPRGVVAACVWDHAAGSGPVSAFWRAVHDLDPEASGEAALAGAREGHLAELLGGAGLTHVADRALTIAVVHPTFDEWWQPYTLGVGPAGDYVAGLAPAAAERLRDRCREMLSPAPFEITATAWAARGTVT